MEPGPWGPRQAQVLPAANWLLCASETGFYDRLMSVLQQCEGPITCAGLGAQSRYTGDTPGELARALPDPVKRFAALLSERAVTIGIRGEYTAEVLDCLGIHNYRIIGCPACFISGEKPPILRQPREGRFLLSVTPANNHPEEARLLALGMAAQADWIMQMYTEMPELALDASTEVTRNTPFTPERCWPGLECSMEELTAYMQRHARLFGTYETWMEYLC